MRERIDTDEAARLYEDFRNWRKVSFWLSRNSRVPFTPDAIQSAVRRQDKAEQ